MTALTWADLPGRRVAVWGVGVEGRASLRRLRADGVEPVLVDRVTGTLPDGTAVVGLDDGGLDLLRRADVVVKSPGISPYGDEARSIVEAGGELVGGLGLWLAGTGTDRVLAVTGTKGKSTTTSIAAGLLAGLGVPHRVGGNIGSCPWDPETAVDDDEPGPLWVIEVSSYQAHDVVLGPRVVAVTSLGEDHLPWHAGSVEIYHRDKLSLATRPGVRHVVAGGTDPLLRERAALLGPDVEWVTADGGAWTRTGPLLGLHNRRNAEIARCALAALGVPGLDDEALLAKAFADFVPLPSRLTAVAEADGVLFVDDSISTTVVSAVAAVRSFPGRRIALLVGGLGRDIDYSPLAGVARDADVRLFTMPTNGPTISRVLRGEGVDDVTDCADLEAAVRAGFAWARPGGVVLLSPAAASFDLFTDYRARGEAFSAVARSLPPAPR